MTLREWIEWQEQQQCYVPDGAAAIICGLVDRLRLCVDALEDIAGDDECCWQARARAALADVEE